jgi:hypothetical protein
MEGGPDAMRHAASGEREPPTRCRLRTARLEWARDARAQSGTETGDPGGPDVWVLATVLCGVGH